MRAIELEINSLSIRNYTILQFL